MTFPCKCNCCLALSCWCYKILLIRLCEINYDVPEIHTCVPKEHAQLFQIADRGGLSAPTQISFAISAIAVQLHTSLVSNELVKKNF